MKQLILTAKFSKAFRRFSQRNIRIKSQVKATLDLLQENIFEPSLNTHQLRGEYAGFYACSCGYDCRIIFTIQKDKNTGEDLIILVNVGTHDEVH
jgi:mRNA interferase YafQ